MWKYILSILILGTQLVTSAQDVETEVGFIYVKAEYLYETKRYDEAIDQYNMVINKQAEYKDALLKRALSKYAMGAYRGVRDDLINYIKLKGVSPDALKLLAMSDYNAGNHDAALNSLKTLLACGSRDGELYHIQGQIYLAKEDFDKACTNWNKASSLRFNKATLQSNKYCKDVATEKPNTGPRPRPGTGSTSSTGKEDKPRTIPGTGGAEVPRPRPGSSNTQSDDMEYDEVVQEEPAEPTQPFDNSKNEIFVDEDLTLIIKNGLGGRKILQQPNILILSEDSGSVAIDIIVNERGRVDDAQFNAGESTMDTRSIVSLAMRKAQEFWFEKSEWETTEGTIIFNITGR